VAASSGLRASADDGANGGGSGRFSPRTTISTLVFRSPTKPRSPLPSVMSSLVSVPPHRRIVTAHVPLPADAGSSSSSAGGKALEPAVTIIFDDDRAATTGGQIWHGHTPADESTQCVYRSDVRQALILGC
jgi:hypothetical protein